MVKLDLFVTISDILVVVVVVSSNSGPIPYVVSCPAFLVVPFKLKIKFCLFLVSVCFFFLVAK